MLQPTSNLIAMLDVAADRGGRMALHAGRLFAVWPEGGETWRHICSVPSGVGLSVQWTLGVEAEIALVCADKAAAEEPAAETTKAGAKKSSRMPQVHRR